jgi:hypothetical protein
MVGAVAMPPGRQRWVMRAPLFVATTFNHALTLRPFAAGGLQPI